MSSRTFEPPDGVDEIDLAIQNLALTLRKYGRIVDADKSESKLLVSQLRRERLRALTAMAKTRALLAEMELEVVQEQLDAMKKQSQSPGTSDEKPSPHQSVLTSPVKLKNSKASEKKSSRNDSGGSSLHKLDKKSLKITKPTCRNCLKLQINKQCTTEIPKRPIEGEPQRTPSDSHKNATVNNVVPETSKSFKQGAKIDVITPCKDKAEVERSSNEVIPKTYNEAPKATPKVGMSPIAKKIFGIANYNVAQHENTAKSRKDSSSRKVVQENAKRTSTPKANSKNRANPTNKAVKPSLSSISQKDKAIVPKKPATEVIRRETGKEQTVKETPSLRISLPLSSKLDSKVEKVRKSLFGVTKEHCSAKDYLKKPSKATPTVGNNRKEKEKQSSQFRKTVSVPHGKVAVQEQTEAAKVLADRGTRGKENMNPQSLPIRICLSEINKNIADFQNKKDKRKSVAVENKKEQRENETVPKPSVRVCVPLTQSNLAYFNRNNVCRQSQEKAQERIPQIADNNVKQTQSVKISVPLNDCSMSNTEAENERYKKNQDFLERQTCQLVAWKNINWDAWEAQKNKEKNTRAESDRGRQYTFVKNGPLRKVSWEEFTRRFGMNQGTNAPSQSPPAKKTCVEQTNDENEGQMKQPTELPADDRTNEELGRPSTQPAENESRAKEPARQVIKPEVVDQDAINAIFNQLMIKKEKNASNADDTRSISSNDTALLCTRCQCLHESKECPKVKYFKFLGIDNFKTEI